MKTQKLFIQLAIVIVLALAIVLIPACSKSTPAPAPTPAPSPKPEPVKPIELRFGAIYPAESPSGAVQVRWIEKIEKETNGKVKITPFWAGTLIGGATNYSDLLARVADIADLTALMTEPASFPLSGLMEWAYFGVRDHSVAQQVGEEVYNAFPEVRAEGSAIKMLYMSGFGNFWLHTTEKPIGALSDLNGLEIITGPPTIGMVYQKFGVSPVMMPTMEFYTALQKGIAKGLNCPMEAMIGMSWHEVTKYHVNMGIYSGPTGSPLMGMNMDAWNELPPDVQKVFDDNIAWYTEEYIKERDGLDAMSLEFVQGTPGHELTTLSQGDLDKFAEGCLEVLLGEAAKIDEQGLPGTAVVTKIRELIEKYN